MTMSRIQKHGLHNSVVREIGRCIVSGELPQGKPLPSESTLGSTLGVSRTALREALRVLAAKGLVQAKQRTGTIVRLREAWNYLDPDVFAWRLDSIDYGRAVQELHELRYTIEPLAASLAATRATAGDLAQIADAYHEMQSATDGATLVDPDVRFHRAIISASGNNLLASVGHVISIALREYFKTSVTLLADQIRSVSLHKIVLDEIKARNPAGASLAMRKVIEDSEEDARRNAARRKRQAKLRKAHSVTLRRGR